MRLVDASLPGFFVSVNKNSKTFKIKADLWVGEPGRKRKVRTITHAIQKVDEISLSSARAKASVLLNQIKSGSDPFSKNGSSASPETSLGRLIDLYIDHLINNKGRREVTTNGYRYEKKKYLGSLLQVPVKDLVPADMYELHDKLTKENGPVVANKAIQLVYRAYKYGRQRSRGVLPENPAADFEYNPKKRPDVKSIELASFPNWFDRISAIDNPLRREMHLLCLFSGLRVGSLKAIEKSWIKPELFSIEMDASVMKSGRTFYLPLSIQMMRIVERAKFASDQLYPGSKWLFPTVSTSSGKVVHVQETRQSKLPGEVGHILRRTHRTIAQKIGVHEANAMLLLDHTIPGISGLYVDTSQLFSDLRRDQQKISNEVQRLIGPAFDETLSADDLAMLGEVGNK